MLLNVQKASSFPAVALSSEKNQLLTNAIAEIFTHSHNFRSKKANYKRFVLCMKLKLNL